MDKAKIRTRNDLITLFRESGFKVGAEIGVADGKFSERLLRLIPGLKLYCVDPWGVYQGSGTCGGTVRQDRNYQGAKERLTKPENNYNVEFLRMMSMEALKYVPDGSLDFVFIDGNHKFDYVMMDIIEWSKKVRKGGIVSGHDYYYFRNGGVIEAVNAYVKTHNLELRLTEANVAVRRDEKCPSFYWTKK